MRKQINKSRFQFIETWVFPKPVEEFLVEKCAEYAPVYGHKDFTHVCCGKSNLGGKRIDIDPANKPDMVADLLELPTLLGENSQDNILADFPWEIKYHDRRYFSYAVRDICKPGGILILNCPWSPWVKGLEILEVWKVGQAFNSYRDLVDVWVLRKLTPAEMAEKYPTKPAK